ncbi:MAG TPA: two-component regulator propeller domain-containing protein, partial [Blastocatellia bacterium]|nr:two-component regulator propeller domain-containing protein [Blastocatellia bacterium]
GFRRLENDQWLSYPVEEVAAWKRANKITNEDAFFYYPASSQALIYLMPHRVSLFNPQTQKTQPLKDAIETRLQSFLDLVPTRTGDLIAVGKKGFAQIRFVKHQPEWTEYTLEKSGLETLETIVEGSDGKLYLTGQAGKKIRRLVRFDGQSWKLLYEGNQPFLRGWAEADGTVWLQCATAILRWHNNRLQEIERRGKLSGSIFSAMPAGNGALWVATTQSAVRYAPAIWRTPDDLPEIDNIVHSLYEDPLGRIWAAATNSLLLLEQGKWKRFPMPDGMLTYTYLTRSLALLNDGRLLVRLDRAPLAYLFDPKNGQFSPLNHPLGHRVQLVVARNKGGAWLWTLGDNGKNWLELYDGQEFKSVIELDSRWVKDPRGGIRDVLETENGDLWIASLGGVGLYQKGRFVDFSHNQELTQNGGFYLLEMDAGKVWVGGREKIYEYDGTNWHVILRGIDKVRSMLKARDGTIWVAASSGLYRYQQGMWLANTEEDGLPATISYDVLEDSRGQIWVGTTRGLSMFHQNADLDPPDTIISAENNLRDAPPSGDIRLVFSGVDKWKYTLSERLLFSTRIDGQPWSEFMTAQEAIFKGLPSGAHRFEVRAMDRNGNIDVTPAVFEFKVLLPWYREMGFLLILSLSLIAILLLTGLAVSNYRQRGKFIQELDQAREHYLHLFDSNPFPMWVYDLITLEFLTVNQSAIDHYGYSLKEFQTMTLMDIRPEEDQERLRSHFLSDSHESGGIEIWRHRKKDGSIIEVEINTQEFVFAGRAARLVVVNDITERRELERQLQQAQKLESIGQLAAGIAHEINTPTQYVNDNTVFLRDAFTDLSRV